MSNSIAANHVTAQILSLKNWPQTEIGIFGGFSSTAANDFTIGSPKFETLPDGWGSFRWGGTVFVDSGKNLQIIASPRDYKLIGTSDFGVWESGLGNVSDKQAKAFEASLKAAEIFKAIRKKRG